MSSNVFGYTEEETELITDAKADERERIRAELIDWLIGRLDPHDAGLINGRRIVDEIDRICLLRSEIPKR